MKLSGVISHGTSGSSTAACSADLAHLRELTGPEHQTTDPDLMACEVIQEALKHRAQVRGASAGAERR